MALLHIATAMPWVYMGGDKGYGKGGGGGKGYGKGWGWGQGYGKGYGKGGRPKPAAVPDEFEAPEGKTYVGTVQAYYKFRGYGFVVPDDLAESGLPGEKVFVHWKNIKSTDRFPALNPEMKVEFTVSVVEKAGVRTLQADSVCLPGGGAVAVQETNDEVKTFVGEQSSRYTGTLKFFNPARGFGYVKLDPDQKFDREVPEEIRVESSEMNCGGANPAQAEDVKVELGIWVTRGGTLKGYNVTLPGGGLLEAIEVVEAAETAETAEAETAEAVETPSSPS